MNAPRKTVLDELTEDQADYVIDSVFIAHRHGLISGAWPGYLAGCAVGGHRRNDRPRPPRETGGVAAVSTIFQSEARYLGIVVFPPFTGTRVMMMPFLWNDVDGSLPPEVARYVGLVELLRDNFQRQAGLVGYLTVDEALVRAGETHRRPGIHVDGLGGWAGEGGGWAKGGMAVAASNGQCRVWQQEFHGEPGPDGDCSHLRRQCLDDSRVCMGGNQAWWLGPMAVHEPMVALRDMERQFVRVSAPSDAPWFDGYTRNPLGIEPSGPILPRREAQMGYRL